jgi:hypothetical protein
VVDVLKLVKAISDLDVIVGNIAGGSRFVFSRKTVPMG